jgi:ribonuclease HI
MDAVMSGSAGRGKDSVTGLWQTNPPGGEPMKRVVIHSDGGCHGNPGPGGWAAVLEYGRHRRELSGAEPATTNNRMELQAAIEALTALKEPCEVDFYTDSEYVRKGVSEWLSKWKRNGWKTTGKQRVKNEDLWRALDACSSMHRVKWHWVKGHAGHEGNERCDRLANEEIMRLKEKFSSDQLKQMSIAFSKKQFASECASSSMPLRSLETEGTFNW